MIQKKILIERDGIVYLAQHDETICICPFASVPVVPQLRRSTLTNLSNPGQGEVELIPQFKACSSNCPHFVLSEYKTNPKVGLHLNCGPGFTEFHFNGIRGEGVENDM